MTIGSTALPDVLADTRTAALTRMAELGTPTRRDEAWRYAPHRRLGELVFGPPREPALALPSALDAHVPALDGPRIVVVNGLVDHERSNLTAPDGVHVSTLADTLADDPRRVAGRLEVDADELTDVFTAANVAFTTDGAVIRVPADTDLDVPIHLVDVTVPDDEQNGTCTSVVLEVGARSSVTVVEARIGFGDTFGGSNIRTTVTLDEDATLEHIVLQDVPETQIHLGRVDVIQGPRSTFKARSFNLGAFYGRLSYDVHLDGAGARADLSGLFFGFGDQTLDQQITVTHTAPDCTSRQSYRGVLDDSSTGVFNGGIDVKPGADGTDAEQSNDNLLLSNRAEINTQPRLEILADEVACKHGATVGQLDETALYYMRSRGIRSDEARRLLINGFADQAVDDVGIEAVRDWITHRLGHDDV